MMIFVLKLISYGFKNDEFCIQNGELCIKKNGRNYRKGCLRAGSAILSRGFCTFSSVLRLISDCFATVLGLF